MRLSYRHVRARLSASGLLPSSKVAHAAWYLLAVDLVAFGLQKTLGLFKVSFAEDLGGWVTFLSLVALFLFAILAYRWLKVKLLWRLRNRLIVTYMFIGVIPAVLLGVMAAASLYLLSGQFANFVVTSELSSHLRSMQAGNAAIASELAAHLKRGEKPLAESLDGLTKRDPDWAHREVCGWYGNDPLPMCGKGAPANPSLSLPAELPNQFQEIVRDHGNLYLRAATTLATGSQKLVVVSSEPLDKALAEKIAAGLGEITLYSSGIDLEEEQEKPVAKAGAAGKPLIAVDDGTKEGMVIGQGKVKSGNEELRPAFTAGLLTAATGNFDREITFGTPLPVVEWESGKRKKAGALLRVQTRPSMLYTRLFAALGDFAKGVESVLFFIAIVFAVIELLALWIGTRLTRTITGAVAQLYDATKHINRGDFQHRIPVKSNDQLATLSNSFNSMTASIENLIEEQKQKQRLENELAIAQEVQAQLYPRQISQLESLEVHGFCRPARTVSGDYYDFLTLDSEKLILAVGDISGKGISAALLMATIHSAVRAYSLEGMPALREPLAVGAASGADVMLAAGLQGAEVSPGSMLSLLNHQLYESTPTEKYATLFLGTYDGKSRILNYSNGGHLPPIILSEDGSLRRLESGGTVVGLFDNQSYDEGSTQLRHGEIFLAYSDGVTEPENDFGEFGEQRLIDLVKANRDLPLPRISEIVTAAVDDWIGAKEQPDDITLVLARVR